MRVVGHGTVESIAMGGELIALQRPGRCTLKCYSIMMATTIYTIGWGSTLSAVLIPRFLTTVNGVMLATIRGQWAAASTVAKMTLNPPLSSI